VNPAGRIIEMSYVVLARKYRPRRFEQMVGQDHVVRALTHALEQGRLHHAYLFTGTRGIGKTTVSRILAKSLNCTGPDGQGGVTATPCGTCPACVEIDADRYIDYIELDAASNRGIDEVRDLIERATYKPSVGRYKVFMIDEAHQLTKEAFNALLKTLEEPPEYLKFVLATTDPEKMLPTVLSRCLQFNLRPMAPETVAEHLAKVLDAEAIPHDKGSLRLLSRAARGSMRDALSLTDQAIAYGAGSLEETAVRAMLGAVDRSHANRIVGHLARRDAAALLAEVDALRGLGLSAAGTLEEIARLLQQMAVEQALPGALDAEDSDTEAARTLAAQMPAEETQLLYSIALHGRAELSLAPDEYAGLVMVLLRFMAFPPGGGGGGGGGAPSGAQSAPASRPAASGIAAAGAASSGGASVAGAPVAAAAANPEPRAAAPAAPEARTPAPAAVARPAATIAAPAPVPAPALPPVQPPAAPLMRPAAPRAVAATATTDDDPPWGDEEPDVYEDDLPAPTRSRFAPSGDGRPAAPAGRPTFEEDPEAAAEPAPRADRAVAAPPPLPPFERTELGTQWAGQVAQWSGVGMFVALVRELAMQAELVASTDTGEAVEWRLRVARETLRNPALVEKLANIARQQLGREVRIVVEAGEPQDSPSKRETYEADRRQRAAIDNIQSDPTVRALLEQFRTARILPGSIKPL
jgi:DNA polymerase-3 subunit gamma/tau